MRKQLFMAATVAGLALGSAGALYGEGAILPSTDSDAESGLGEIESTTCGLGTIRECGTVTQRSCDRWVASSGSLSGSWGATGGAASGSASGTCISWTESRMKIYKDKYKPKAT